MPDKITQYPTLAKIDEVHETCQILSEFMEWLCANGMAVCTTANGLRGTSFWPIRESAEVLIAWHLGVDLVAAEHERRALLADFNRTPQEP